MIFVFPFDLWFSKFSGASLGPFQGAGQLGPDSHYPDDNSFSLGRVSCCHSLWHQLDLATSGHAGGGGAEARSLALPALPALVEVVPFLHVRPRRLFPIKRDFHLLSLFLNVLWEIKI